jgi:hypothetical protein
MHRVAPLLLLAGVVLLVSWVVAPAAPSPAPIAAPGVSLVADQLSPVLADVATQVDRLKNRLEITPDLPRSHRDPFRFGARPEPVRMKSPAPVVEAADALPPPPVLPRLLAIVANTTDGGLLRTAVFSVGDEMQIVKPGDTIGKFVVRSIGTDVAEVVEISSGATFRIALR